MTGCDWDALSKGKGQDVQEAALVQFALEAESNFAIKEKELTAVTNLAFSNSLRIGAVSLYLTIGSV